MSPRTVAVFFASPVRNRSNDLNYIYHPQRDFFYLTGFSEPHTALVIFKEPHVHPETKKYTNEILFTRSRLPRQELYDGLRLSPEEAIEKHGIAAARMAVEFPNLDLNADSLDKILFFPLPKDVRDTKDTTDLYDLLIQFKENINYTINYDAELQRNQWLDTHTLAHHMTTLREIKTPEEILLLRRAVNVTCIAQNEALRALQANMSESEVQGIQEFVFKKYGLSEGFPSIVGAGNNGCTLHYIDNNKRTIGPRTLILMDLGAEYHGYTADVTRTAPINGRFNPEQRALYNLVLASQEETFRICKPGTTFRQINKTSHRVVAEGLLKLGLVSKLEDYRRYFPHAITHHIGLDMHDTGHYDTLAANMVITIEPGIYIPDGSPCDKKWWEIAIRIEDDILITETGYELLSNKAPRTVDAIEALMAQPSHFYDYQLPNLDDTSPKKE